MRTFRGRLYEREWCTHSIIDLYIAHDDSSVPNVRLDPTFITQTVSTALDEPSDGSPEQEGYEALLELGWDRNGRQRREVGRCRCEWGDERIPRHDAWRA